MSPEEIQNSFTWQQPQERPLQFPQAMQDKSLQMGVERVLSLGVAKNKHQNLGAQCSQLHHGLPSHSHSNLQNLILSQSMLSFNHVTLEVQFAL